MRSAFLLSLVLMLFASHAFAGNTPTTLQTMPKTAPAPSTALAVKPPGVNTAAAVSQPFSKDFIQSVFPSSYKPGLMTIAGKTVACHGLGVQGGQYACYGTPSQKGIDCFFDRYINQTPIAQKCGDIPLPINMTKPETDERVIGIK